MKSWVIKTIVLLLLTSLIYANEQTNHPGLEEGSSKNEGSDNSIEFHQKVIQSNMELIKKYSQLGDAWAQKGDYDKARECYKEIASINTKIAKSCHVLGAST